MIEDLVSIIIVNYNTEKFLENCIVSINKYTRDVNYEIIVVDNNSEKGSVSSLIEKYPAVRFHFSEENHGFGRANNIGASIAKGEYLFFLNPDTLLINNAVFLLYEYLKGNPQVGICGGNMYRGDMTPASSFYDIDFLTYEYKIIFNIKRYPGFNYTTGPNEVKVIVGADLFIRKSVFFEFGGFDKDFFMYFEEVELCYRLRKANYKIVSVPAAEIIHLQGGSAENKNEELGKWSYREHWYSKFLFFSKTKGKLQTKILYCVYILKLRMAMLYFSIRRNKGKLEYWNLKKNIINDAFGRYLKYLSNK
ncbi:hypothetical protein CLV62_1153 [Dysgonomonas alginatilytica]|uniref:Glycosyltransferase 2-like domain-containing protein n=1 Tax=Dysgonomonas alginatilytica TaxID=1605892 RepID=A0A2V3PP85_9BACT|nr:glycosyltransferase family 2 protein [Dysgonomonas alginatilytica]PXV63121.1 hypothetical protein CLV62_1153 [Dysgonomonas alginatilytica]